jgi:hypothetical protein
LVLVVVLGMGFVAVVLVPLELASEVAESSTAPASANSSVIRP